MDKNRILNIVLGSSATDEEKIKILKEVNLLEKQVEIKCESENENLKEEIIKDIKTTLKDLITEVIDEEDLKGDIQRDIESELESTISDKIEDELDNKDFIEKDDLADLINEKIEEGKIELPSPLELTLEQTHNFRENLMKLVLKVLDGRMSKEAFEKCIKNPELEMELDRDEQKGLY